MGALSRQLNLSPYSDESALSPQRAHITHIIRLLHPLEHHLHSLASHERVKRERTGRARVREESALRARESDNKYLSAVQFVLVPSIGFNWWCDQVKREAHYSAIFKAVTHSVSFWNSNQPLSGFLPSFCKGNCWNGVERKRGVKTHFPLPAWCNVAAALVSWEKEKKIALSTTVLQLVKLLLHF